MSNLQELDKLDRAIKDAEFRLKSIEANIVKVEHEINVLIPFQQQLELNIDFLKKSEVIPIALEFKKARQELTRTKARIGALNSDLSRSSQACSEIVKIIEKFRKDFKKLSEVSSNNILKGKFGGRNGT